ncbi:MAG: hypothetical protein M1436_01475 [Acidobacteria bacterium]|nr:hypothetical protein [Acidobacteriota bacterium]
MNKHNLLRAALCLTALVLSSTALTAGEKNLMHCFAFTAVDNASDADWQAFFKATDALPEKIPGLTKVWYGKLRSPLTLFNVDAKTRKELAGGAKSATGEVTRLQRQWGVCMEMKDAAALKSYDASPAHKEWVAAYSKVRVYGTTTYDILGQ